MKSWKVFARFLAPLHAGSPAGRAQRRKLPAGHPGGGRGLAPVLALLSRHRPVTRIASRTAEGNGQKPKQNAASCKKCCKMARNRAANQNHRSLVRRKPSSVIRTGSGRLDATSNEQKHSSASLAEPAKEFEQKQLNVSTALLHGALRPGVVCRSNCTT